MAVLTNTKKNVSMSVRYNDDSDADALGAVAEHDPVAAQESRRRLPVERLAGSIPRRAGRQRPALPAWTQLIGRLEPARKADLDPLPLRHLDRA